MLMNVPPLFNKDRISATSAIATLPNYSKNTLRYNYVKLLIAEGDGPSTKSACTRFGAGV